MLLYKEKYGDSTKRRQNGCSAGKKEVAYNLESSVAIFYQVYESCIAEPVVLIKK